MMLYSLPFTCQHCTSQSEPYTNHWLFFKNPDMLKATFLEYTYIMDVLIILTNWLLCTSQEQQTIKSLLYMNNIATNNANLLWLKILKLSLFVYSLMITCMFNRYNISPTSLFVLGWLFCFFFVFVFFYMMVVMNHVSGAGLITPLYYMRVFRTNCLLFHNLYRHCCSHHSSSQMHQIHFHQDISLNPWTPLKEWGIFN